MEYLGIVPLVGLILAVIYSDKIIQTYEVIKWNLQIVYQTLAMVVDIIVETIKYNFICKRIDKTIMKGLNQQNPEEIIWYGNNQNPGDIIWHTNNITTSIDNYLQHTTVKELVSETSNWKEEMKDDLSFYCPDIVISRIIGRIEEIIEEEK